MLHHYACSTEETLLLYTKGYNENLSEYIEKNMYVGVVVC